MTLWRKSLKLEGWTFQKHNDFEAEPGSYLLTTWLPQFFHRRKTVSGLAHPGTMVVSGKRETGEFKTW